MKTPKSEPPQPANTGTIPAKDDPAGREFEGEQKKVPNTTSRDKWGDLEGQQGGQGWKKP